MRWRDPMARSDRSGRRRSRLKRSGQSDDGPRMEVLHGSRAPATLTAERSIASRPGVLGALRPRILAAVALVIAAVALIAVTLPHGRP